MSIELFLCFVGVFLVVSMLAPNKYVCNSCPGQLHWVQLGILGSSSRLYLLATVVQSLARCRIFCNGDIGCLAMWYWVLILKFVSSFGFDIFQLCCINVCLMFFL